MKTKVFVLTRQGRDCNDQDTLEVIGVYATKTAAKEKMREKQREIYDFYNENYPDEFHQYEEGVSVNWGCSCEDAPVYDELLITEKTIDND